MEPHFVYCCETLTHGSRLKPLILNGIQKYGIRRAMVTEIRLWRYNLITKERMENYSKGKESEKLSVNDDLESLFDNIRLGKKPDDFVPTYFLPKLTKEELKLVERKDYNFMHTFMRDMRADVSKAEMELSESDSKGLYPVIFFFDKKCPLSGDFDSL